MARGARPLSLADDLAGIGVDQQVDAATVGGDADPEDRTALRTGVEYTATALSDGYGTIDAAVAGAVLTMLVIVPLIILRASVFVAMAAMAIVVLLTEREHEAQTQTVPQTIDAHAGRLSRDGRREQGHGAYQGAENGQDRLHDVKASLYHLNLS